MDDLLDVVTWPIAVKGASITLAQEVRRGDGGAGHRRGACRLYQRGQGQPIPKSLRQLMKADLSFSYRPIGKRPSTPSYIGDRLAASSKSEATMSRPPLPPFTRETAAQKARMAEDAWNSRDPERVSLAYTEDSRWRNRSEVFEGRAAIVAFLTRKWAKEHEYRLIKDLWAFDGNRIAVRFQYEWHDDAGQWHRSYGNEQWEFDEHGLMRRREASINDIAIAEKDRRFHWAAPGLGRRMCRDWARVRSKDVPGQRQPVLNAVRDAYGLAIVLAGTTDSAYAAALWRASSALYSSNSSAIALAMLGRVRSRS